MYDSSALDYPLLGSRTVGLRCRQQRMAAPIGAAESIWAWMAAWILDGNTDEPT